jgi:hypothetical protein
MPPTGIYVSLLVDVLIEKFHSPLGIESAGMVERDIINTSNVMCPEI